MRKSPVKLVIAGAGCSGLGVALAAARCGWQVLLIEAQDIASGTSTASTKLIHGGVRYLESALKRLSYADWHLVQEALHERAWMLQSHPVLCHPLPILLPTRSPLQKLYYGLGLSLYEKLSSPKNLPKTTWIKKEDLYTLFPSLKAGFSGAWEYWDGQFQDRLYAVHLALFLHQRYAVDIRTRHQVTGIRAYANKVIVQIQPKEGISYEEEADFFVNATGPWIDTLRQRIRPGVPPRLRLSRGSHLVLSRQYLPLESGFLIPKTHDGRVLFVLPWLENTALVGTTDEEAPSPEWNPTVPEKEEAYLRAYLHRYFDLPQDFPIEAAFAGYRPLVATKATPTARIARTHVIEVWPQHRTLHLMGGKWTTFRKMGADAVAAIAQALSLSLPPPEPLSAIVPDLTELETYKTKYPLPIAPNESFTEGEVRFWREKGWAQTPEDIVEGRWQLHLISQKRAQKLLNILKERWETFTLQ
ncbi:MAG: FAD-dependent oxidoreductase [Bacteroidia bacterium]|nr:FAD-dependent oxidoreductase [Bacteroidia bacterium]